MKSRTGQAPGRLSAAPAPRPKIGRAGEVRLIGGQWKRSKLAVPAAAGLRPTPDRVRETLFNWLGQDLSGRRCLDAFAGSGALGFEAASRGASAVLLVELDAELVRTLLAARERLGGQAVISVQRGDGLSVLRGASTASWDVIFLDPPYESKLLAPALAAAHRVLAPGGLVYAESSAPVAAGSEGFELVKQLRAGAVHAQLFRRVY